MIVFLLLHVAIYVSFLIIVNPAFVAKEGGFFALTFTLTIRNWIVDLPTYCFLLSSIYIVDFYRRFQAEQLKSSELKAALATSQLNVLKMQIHPHFLFNTLNAISALVNDSPKIATQTIAQLGDLLRMSLKSDAAQEISLKQELDFLGRYVQIQQTLLQDRLGVEWKIAPETLDAAIPNMILQPLVENAINHGISPVESGGRIVIAAAKENGNLKLSVSDNGQGLSSKAELLFQNGIGLYNSRERLKHLYGDKQEFKISEIPTGGVLVQLEMPTVIFVTAYDEFALRAFDVNAIGYLLKPFEEDRFIRVLEIAKHQIKGNLHKGSDDRLYQLIKEVKNEPKYVKRLALKLGESSNILLTDEIDWISTAGNYVELHIGRNKYHYREQMNQLEQKLDPDKFVRVHRSTIVNIERIKTLHPLFNKDYLIILKDGTELNLSRTYYKRLSSLFAGF
ncbi:MAG: LytTR family transcriptional regulator DNA-binding domain-containing protein [Acidobacteria bacterium]|nr:LytTR family transcriptional regulator DNA-binding domain-containing protein [Acidobacteriota bacterium]